MKERILTDDEVLALDKILVEGNKRIIGLHYYCHYYCRMEGVDDIPSTTLADVTVMLEDLKDHKPNIHYGAYLRAIVNDIVYLSAYNDRQGAVYSFGADSSYSKSHTDGYMAESSYLKPILKPEEK